MTGSSGATGSSQLLLQHMGEMSSSEFVEFFERIDVVLFDCDGVLWLGNTVMRNAQDLVKKFRALGKRVFFVTNNSTKTREQFVEKFNMLGFEANVDEIISTSYLAALHLKERGYNGKAYVIGTNGVTEELAAVGIQSLPIGPDSIIDDGNHWRMSSGVRDMQLDPQVAAVVVGFDEFFSYKKMYIAASYLRNPSTLFIATNTDEQFPGECIDFVIPGTGAIVNAVKTAAGREPVVMGKPSKLMFHFIQRFHKIDPKRTLMIGDRGNTDILFGRKSQLWTLLVLSGVTTLNEAREWNTSDDFETKSCVPDFYIKDVASLYQLILDNENKV